MNPEISIVVPLYNAEKYIAECIDSILEQTFEDFELIIVDDKSTDQKFRRVFISKSWTENISRQVRLFHGSR